MAAIAITALFMAGCEGDGDDDDSSSISGTWRGTIKSTIGTFSTVLVLDQDGNDVSGTWDGSYPVSGTLNGVSLALSGSAVESGVTFTYSMELVWTGESMSGSLRADGKRGSQTVTSTGTISLTRTAKALVGRGFDETESSLMQAITRELH